MKLRELYKNFKLIQKVYDNCSYDRIFELLDAYQEIESKIVKVEKERQKIKAEFSDKSGNIPKNKLKDADAKFRELLDVDVDLKEKMIFKQEDFKNSGLKGTDIVQLKDFLEIKK